MFFCQICSLELKLDYNLFEMQRLLHIAPSKKFICFMSAKFSECHLLERFNLKMPLVTTFKDLEEENKPKQI